ncbi:MAG TPA: hypothetical protein VEQ09_05915, partial [Aquabacterium sp.]|nr:hypothetical protein [Aquabacterium sp.]
PTASPPPVASGPAVRPSPEWLRSLEDQVHAGYVRGVHKVLDELEGAEPQCAAFAQRMRALAKQFQLDRMAQELSAALDEVPSTRQNEHV